jgi:peptidoglycan-N-acetylglucosamine deacetylase
MKMRASLALLALALAVIAARGQSTPEAACPAEALGTARVMPVEAALTPRVGRKHFYETLPLAPREVVLTFDDGPALGTTARVLDALKRECARASFFLLGRNALAHARLPAVP